MMNAVVLGVWVCLVTLGTSYGAMVFFAPEKAPEENATYFGGIDYAKTEMVGVPVIRDGELQGYVLFQLVYTIEQKISKALAVQPDVFLVDYAYRRIYGDLDVDYRRQKPKDLDKFLGEVRAEVNKRYGQEVIKDLLVERLTYLSADAVRSGNYSQEDPGGGTETGGLAGGKK